MKKLKVGYWPLTSSLKTAGDRRRLVFWAQLRGHEIITDLSRKVDVIVATENSDFNSAIFANKGVPIIFDLVDAYLSPTSTIDDFARGIAKRITGQITGGIKPFSHHVKRFCSNSDAVICSSIEQETLIKKYNTNTHIILDSHEEFPFFDAKERRNSYFRNYRILWEGQPATIRGVKFLSPALVELAQTFQLHFEFVTDTKYYKMLNKYFERNTSKLLNRDLSQIANLVRIVPWTVQNLVDCASNSQVAMIPLNLSIPMQNLKPENRLLIMWRLGLPCLTSPSPAFVRVAERAGVSATCKSQQEWIDNFSELLCNSDFATKQVIAGQNYLLEHHNRDILLKKWDQVFDTVLN